jgi:quinol monooxygenase YgiN
VSASTQQGMVVVAGVILFETQEARDGAVAASIEVQRATRAEEPGCLAYCFAADPAEPTVMQVYELWTDGASLQAHFAHPNYTAMRAILRGFPRAGASVTAKHLVSASSPVYQPDGTPTADFTA